MPIILGRGYHSHMPYDFNFSNVELELRETINRITKVRERTNGRRGGK